MLTDSSEASGPHKHKLLTKVTTNGNPEVEWKKKKLEAKKQSTKLAPTKKQSSTWAPVNTTTKPTAKTVPWPWPWCPPIKIEEIEDELDCHTSVPLRNPQNILEATNGSDDDVNTTPPPWKSTKKPVVTKWHPSVEVEEVFNDESDHHTSVLSCNPWHILEATDGSDDDEEDLAPDGNEEDEAPEESNEAKLGV